MQSLLSPLFEGFKLEFLNQTWSCFGLETLDNVSVCAVLTVTLNCTHKIGGWGQRDTLDNFCGVQWLHGETARESEREGDRGRERLWPQRHWQRRLGQKPNTHAEDEDAQEQTGVASSSRGD